MLGLSVLCHPVASHPVEDALPELLAAFQRLNLDSKGRLTEEEFARLPTEVIPLKDLKKLSVTDLAQLFQLLDVDGSPSVIAMFLISGPINSKRW